MHHATCVRWCDSLTLIAWHNVLKMATVMMNPFVKTVLWFALLTGPIAHAQPLAGQYVPDMCTTIETGADLFRVECRYTSITFVQGYVEGQRALQAALSEALPRGLFCVPLGTRYEDIFLAVAEWTAVDADRIRLPIRTSMTLALSAVYPCN